MKNIIKRILVVLVLVVALAIFTACEETIYDLTDKVNATRCEWFGHTVVVTGDVAPTCLEGGMTGDGVCAVCGVVVFENAPLDPKGHFWVDATCFSPKICINCDLVEGEPLEHVIVDVEAKESTCMEWGYNAHKACQNCDYTEGKENYPLVDHSLVDVDAKESTCKEAGYSAHKACKHCDYTEGKEDYELVDHSWGEPDENGDVACLVCGEAKPIDNPADEPTDDPTDNPTDSPEDNPTDEPTDNPTDTPTDEPTNTPEDESTEGSTEE